MKLTGIIRKYAETDFEEFKNLFREYMSKEFEIFLSEEQVNDVCAGIERQVKDHIIFLDLLVDDKRPVGFIIYQIDSEQSDWCEKEGYGFIREVFVAENFRNKGWGRKLVSGAEQLLSAQKVPHIYLTSDNNDFWSALGYRNSGEKSDKNGDPIFIK